MNCERKNCKMSFKAEPEVLVDLKFFGLFIMILEMIIEKDYLNASIKFQINLLINQSKH